MRKSLKSLIHTGLTPLHKPSSNKLLLSLLVAAATASHAGIITPQIGGSIDPVGGSDIDFLASGSATVAEFQALSGKVIQANWSGISGTTGNTIDGGDVDVRINHVANAFSASASTNDSYNTADVGTGYLWTGTNGQQVEILFGTADAVTPSTFVADRTVQSAGLALLNFGGAYTDVTITYLDSSDGVLSEQSFVGALDSGTGAGGADFFTGFTSDSANIAKVTIDITRNGNGGGSSSISLDALTYAGASPVSLSLLSSSPANNETDVALDADLTATFSENIEALAGSIELRLASDDSLVESFDVTDPAEVSIVDNVATINPTSDLILNTAYTVVIPAGAFVDSNGGESGPTTWSFSTTIPDSVTIDFDPTGELATEFSAGGYSEDASGGLDSSVGVTLTGSTGAVNSLDGPQRSWFPAGTFSPGTGTTMTVGAFFKASSFTSGQEILRLGLTNGGTDTFAGLPYASINWTGTAAQLDVRSGVATDPTTFSLSTGQWYYFEASFTRGATNGILYELAVANADSSGNVGSTIQSFSDQNGSSMDSAQQNQAIHAAFRGMQAAGVLDNFYASRAGASQLRVSYAEWIDTFYTDETDPAIIGLNADPDGDGNDNGVENFFGTAPDTFSQGLVTGAVDTGAGTFTFTHPQGDLALDLAAAYLWSTDLENFNPAGTTGGTTVTFSTSTVDGITTVTATATPAPAKLFVAVEVTQMTP